MTDTIVACSPQRKVTFYFTAASGEIFIIGMRLLDNLILFHKRIHVIFCFMQLSRDVWLIMHNMDRQLKAWPMLYASATFVYTFKYQINHLG